PAASSPSRACSVRLWCPASSLFPHPPPPERYTLSLHDALPILARECTRLATRADSDSAIKLLSPSTLVSVLKDWSKRAPALNGYMNRPATRNMPASSVLYSPGSNWLERLLAER